MLSANSSFMATNWPEVIFAASFAVISGSAEERTTAWPCLAVLVPSPLIAVRRAGRVASDCVTPMAGLETLVRLCLLLGGARPVPPLQSKEEERRGDRDRDRDRGRGGKEEVR